MLFRSATIQNIFVGDAAGGGDNTRPSCWPFEALRVAPSGTLDTFLDWDWRSYCRLSSGANVERTALHVVVRFTDDDGRDGQMLAIINTSGAS